MYVPETAVFDVHSYVSSLQNECEEGGVSFVSNCKFISACKDQDGINSPFLVNTNQGDIRTDYLINAAGLEAPVIASNVLEYPSSLVPKMYFAKGNYFKISSKPFSRLVYPLPQEGGLGIHATIDALDGSVRFGPDVEWLKSSSFGGNSHRGGDIRSDKDEDCDDVYEFKSVPDFDRIGAYDIQTDRESTFYSTVRTYYPTLKDDALTPDYSGIRPKLLRPHLPVYEKRGKATSELKIGDRDLGDFVIENHQTHHVRGLINLYGIESPGLTSSLSIAEYVVKTMMDY